MMKRNRLRRTVSEPSAVTGPSPQGPTISSGICRMESSSLSRERKRVTIATFEQGRDIVSVWMNEWTTNEICAVLSEVVPRCNLHQMEFLWTALESVPHKDFLYKAMRKYPSFPFQPLSTPISKEVKERLHRSRYRENKLLHRTQSMYINHSVSLPSQSPIPESTPLLTLPGLKLSSAPTPGGLSLTTNPAVTPPEDNDDTTVRLISPTRRHMTISLSKPGSPSCFQLPEVKKDAWSDTTKQRHSGSHPHQNSHCPMPSDKIRRKSKSSAVKGSLLLPTEGQMFLKWFSSLEKDWQQQDILQLIIWSLNEKELYCLAIVLLSRQYRDFIGELPLSLALQILLHVPGKDILIACKVSKLWYKRCTDEDLWKRKCGQLQLGLPRINQSSWRQFFIDNIKLNRNWRLGRSRTLSVCKHTDRVLCVCINAEEGLCATGSGDCTIRVWQLKGGRLLNTIEEQSRVWSLSFYGLNLLISGCSDKCVKIWNIRTGKCLKVLEGHMGTIWALKRKGEILITGSHDKTAILWNIRQCRYNNRLLGHTGAVFGVDLNDDCTQAFTCSGDKTVRVWNTDNGECYKVIHSTNGQSVQSLHYSESLIAFSAGATVFLWCLNSNKLLQKFTGHEKRVECIHLQTHGSNAYTIVSSGRDGFIKYWNTKSGHCIRTLGYQSSSINSIDRDSTRIVTVTDAGTLTIWDFNPLSTSLEPSSSSPSSRPCTAVVSEAKSALMISQHRSLLKHKQKMMLKNAKTLTTDVINERL